MPLEIDDEVKKDSPNEYASFEMTSPHSPWQKNRVSLGSFVGFSSQVPLI